MRFSADLLHLIIEAVVGLFREMAGVCAFFMPIILLVLSAMIERIVLTNKSNKDGKNKINYSIQTGSHDTARDDAHDGADGVGCNGDEDRDVLHGRRCVW